MAAPGRIRWLGGGDGGWFVEGDACADWVGHCGVEAREVNETMEGLRIASFGVIVAIVSCSKMWLFQRLIEMSGCKERLKHVKWKSIPKFCRDHL